MKKAFVIFLVIFASAVYGQKKYPSHVFNQLMEVKGTEYVIAKVDTWKKIKGSNANSLLFINTINGQTNQVNLVEDGYFHKIEQVKIDSLGINCLVALAKTVDLDNKKGIDWQDPIQIIVLSVDGKKSTQLTEDNFFVKTWVVNKTTGTIVISGYYDINKNKKYDKADKAKISIYSLKTLQLITKI